VSVLRQLLIEEEGRIPHAYLVDKRRGGRLPDHIIDALLDHDIVEHSQQAERIPGYLLLNEIQRAAIVSMVFQLGFEPFDGDGFNDFSRLLAALRVGDVRRAAAEGRHSRWAREQTPRRAERQMRMLDTGLWQPFHLS
jgi:GH24 family phage-related lysozyme (muramidase)